MLSHFREFSCEFQNLFFTGRKIQSSIVLPRSSSISFFTGLNNFLGNKEEKGEQAISACMPSGSKSVTFDTQHINCQQMCFSIKWYKRIN